MSKHYFITGGAGFIGSNYVNRLLARGENVTIYDNLSRAGAPLNLAWLHSTYNEGAFNLIVGDLKDADLLRTSAQDADIIVHLAGQVAVTSSVLNPRKDFEDNALGTFNVLEAARLSGRKPIVLYASTNKVYGGMEDVRLAEHETRYSYEDYPQGISETQPLDFHSPYGCSKGAGDQYVRDYHRIYNLPTVVFRQSTIYGPRQFGIEDQGYLAWFIIAAVMGNPITIYGDGKQVRDMLYVDDLLNVYDSTIEKITVAAGKVYNVGGGTAHTISIWKELGPILEGLLGREIPVSWVEEWRPGDQRIFVSNINKAWQDLGWQPIVDVEAGVQRLFDWVSNNIQLFS
ncbi:MAG: GDP-mannose 4,6-dehydratase [Chloroflexi bacterium]|nr:GDP-mannose 4,6-dehydratase [Chloroflexota bacterium]